ncbi:MAG: tripartite tricarboxylate transporter permease [Deltaproteobacteria bacterium]|nr:tripartite tricarboxylate transporter permease [Deltaproteobacteria bacterium]
MLEAMALAASRLAEPMSILMLLLGTLLGASFGALPGLGAILSMAVALPFSFGMDPMHAMFMFAGVMSAGAFGGSVPAILLNTPGTAQNAATCLDGYPMAKQGEGGRAIAISAMACFVGSLGGVVVTLLLIPVVKPLLYAFGPPEYFWLTAFGLVAITVAAKGNMIKGLIGGGLGVLISTIGYTDMFGVLRYTMGSEYLWDGIPLVPFMVGVFAISELFVYSARGGSTARLDEGARDINWRKQAFQGIMDVVARPLQAIRSAMVGAGIGLIPGLGGPVASFVSYMVAMRRSKHPEQFGQGSPEGLIGCETANDAKDGGALLPTVAFGIPGSPDQAILLGAFILHGIVPGPLLMRDHMDIIYALLFGIVLSQVVLSGIGLLSAPIIARFSVLPSRAIAPFVLVLVFVGTHMVRSNIFDVGLAILAGVFGYMMRRFGFPLITLVMGFILGPLAEEAFLQSLQMSDWRFTIFFTRPAGNVLLLLILLILVFPFVRARWGRKRKAVYP